MYDKKLLKLVIQQVPLKFRVSPKQSEELQDMLGVFGIKSIEGDDLDDYCNGRIPENMPFLYLYDPDSNHYCYGLTGDLEDATEEDFKSASEADYIEYDLAAGRIKNYVHICLLEREADVQIYSDSTKEEILEIIRKLEELLKTRDDK